MIISFSHRELSLALFALEGGALPPTVEDPCSPDEHACPVAESLEELFGSPGLTPEKKLAGHLVKHLQQGWIECGLMDLGNAGTMSPGQLVLRQMEPGSTAPEIQRASVESAARDQRVSAGRMAHNISKWNCEIELAPEERRLLSDAVGRMPRSAWISMPRTMWRLRRKLKTG